jgi:hypothetical protein
MSENTRLSTPVVFRAKGTALIAMWLCVVFCIFVFLGTLLMVRGAALGSVIFGFLAFLFFAVISIAILNNWSDVVIDDKSISRRIFGSTWQRMDWENVGSITAFPVSGGLGHAARAFNIFPKTKPKFRVLPSGKMVFSDELENASKMIDFLNNYSAKCCIEIKIAKTIGGELVSSDHL